MRRSHNTILVVALLLVCAAFSIVLVRPQPIGAQGVGASITGYAWSDTSGWVSLDGTEYGLSVAADGVISGYAWSEHLGWVSANDADLSGCPSGSCTAKITGGAMSGWLKALAGGSSQSGGWDGWISLSGSSPSYGIAKNDDGTFTGYAWGSDVVGWVDFSYAQTDYAVCTPATTYTCNDINTIARTTVTAQCETSVAYSTCTAPQFCSQGSPTCLDPATLFVQFTDSDGNSQDGHLKVRPLLVPKGSPTKLYWNVGNVSSCSVHGTNDQNWTGAFSGANGTMTAGINQQTVFTLTCLSIADTPQVVVNESKAVNIVPVFKEK